MNKKLTATLVVAAIIVAGVIGFLIYTMQKQKAESAQMLELAEMDKREMENEYEQFAMQYNEMKMQINNDSLVAQLEKEQQRTEELLEELKRVKSSDAAEIMRLKKELATLRKVLQSFVHQIDSLNRLNEELTQENSNLSSQNESLSSKVEIASQLDATGIWAEGRNKKGKAAKKIKDVKKFVIGFRIARNVTTSTGIRSIYLRISTPTGDVLTKGGTFQYENRNLEYSIRKDIEYTGEEQSVQVYWDVAEALSAGTYRVDIFADGHNIGTSSFSFEK